MELSNWDGKCVRILDSDGAVFDGECAFDSAEYCLAAFGREEDALEIDHWLFYASQIRSIVSIETPTLFFSRRVHRMRLQPEPMEMIESGQKQFELRLNDEKRRALQNGDAIRFESTEDETETLYVSVEALYRFDSFDALYAALPLRAIGYSEETIAAASPRDMDAYYTPEEQAHWGVLAIRVRDLAES